jgi:hypothetical protein
MIAKAVQVRITSGAMTLKSGIRILSMGPLP